MIAKILATALIASLATAAHAESDYPSNFSVSPACVDGMSDAFKPAVEAAKLMVEQPASFHHIKTVVAAFDGKTAVFFMDYRSMNKGVGTHVEHKTGVINTQTCQLVSLD